MAEVVVTPLIWAEDDRVNDYSYPIIFEKFSPEAVLLSTLPLLNSDL